MHAPISNPTAALLISMDGKLLSVFRNALAAFLSVFRNALAAFLSVCRNALAAFLSPLRQQGLCRGKSQIQA
jgi:hypothetical protein